MPRSIWSGAVAFGLVSVPVKLYSAVSPKTVRFHQLHAADHVRIQQKRFCPADGEEVPYEEIVKGYEIAPDRYIVIEPGELDALAPRKTRTIDIEDFVSLTEIDPVYYDHPYYLVPGAGGAKPYRLLVDAMADSGKVAIARFVLRSKEQLVALRPLDGVLAMATMNFHDEVLDPRRLDELPGEDVQTTDRELAIARQLVESLAAPFDPARYTDTYREAVLELIERKAEGGDISLPPPAEAPSVAPDLMSALQASLAEVRRRTEQPADEPAETTKPKAKTRARAASTKEEGRAPRAPARTRKS